MGFCAKSDCIAPAYSRGLCRGHARERDEGRKQRRETYATPRERVYEGVRAVYEAESDREYQRAWARLRAAVKPWMRSRR